MLNGVVTAYLTMETFFQQARGVLRSSLGSGHVCDRLGGRLVLIHVATPGRDPVLFGSG